MTRQQAADYLGVSTRSIDRYVKKGTLSYKKVANKVILSEQELVKLKHDFDLLKQQPAIGTRERTSSITSDTLATQEAVSSMGGISEFAQILTDKDKTIEEKNQLIFMLQRKIGEVETKLTQMVALPELTHAKEEFQTQITELEQDKKTLQSQVRKERMRNAIYVGLIVIAAVVLIVIMS